MRPITLSFSLYSFTLYTCSETYILEGLQI